MAKRDEAIVLERKTAVERAREERMTRLRDLEDSIFERSCRVVDAGLAWSEVEAAQQEPPPDWIAEYGPAEARQRLNVAKAAWMPKSLAPTGIDLSVKVMVGIAKARGQRVTTQNNQLNVQICLPPPTSKEHPAEEEDKDVIDVDP